MRVLLAELRLPLGDNFWRIATVKMPTPRIRGLTRTVSEQNAFDRTQHFGRDTADNQASWHIFVDHGTRRNQRTRAHDYSWHHATMGRNDGETLYPHADKKTIAGWMWVVGQHYIRKKPDEILNHALLANVHVGMGAHEIADLAMTLEIREGAYLQITACDGFFANGDPVAGAQVRAKLAALVKDRVRTNVCTAADHERLPLGKRRGMAKR